MYWSYSSSNISRAGPFRFSAKAAGTVEDVVQYGPNEYDARDDFDDSVSEADISHSDLCGSADVEDIYAPNRTVIVEKYCIYVTLEMYENMSSKLHTSYIEI